ncbi:hypothetical protein AAH446_00170 [Erwinia sp. P6884]|uniref:hypothetical protein n=1 Tax=Erwinia sp. P6884 TaxID=3141450 RepID=UPI003193D190
MKTLLIYGATGYTGRMIASQAKSAGLESFIDSGMKVNHYAGITNRRHKVK